MIITSIIILSYATPMKSVPIMNENKKIGLDNFQFWGILQNETGPKHCTSMAAFDGLQSNSGLLRNLDTFPLLISTETNSTMSEEVALMKQHPFLGAEEMKSDIARKSPSHIFSKQQVRARPLLTKNTPNSKDSHFHPEIKSTQMFWHQHQSGWKPSEARFLKFPSLLCCVVKASGRFVWQLPRRMSTFFPTRSTIRILAM